MANTLAQAQAALDNFKKTVGDAQEKAYAVTNKYTTIDQASPTALEQLKALREEYNTTAAEVNPPLRAANLSCVEVINGMDPGPERVAMKEEYKQTTPELAKLSAGLAVVRDQMNAAIATLEKAAAEKTPSGEPAQENKEAKIKVTPDQLSLAIGKGGQNARLANKLTGWKIDIKPTDDIGAEAELSEEGIEETIQDDEEGYGSFDDLKS